VYPESADHVLKYEGKPRNSFMAAEVGSHQNSEGRVHDPEALTVIVNWLKEHTRK
jgi:hypothetical protein